MSQTDVINNNKQKSPTGSNLRHIVLITLFLHHVYALYGVIKASKTELSEELRNRLLVHTDMGLRFFTIWNFIGQMVYMGTEIALPILPSTKLTRMCNKLNWIHFVSMLWPSSVFISTFFWSMYLYDRELILPKHAEVVLPIHLNHSVHTVILLLNVVEFFMSKRLQVPQTPSMRLINFWYMITYALVLNFTFVWDGVWIYPFLRQLTWNQRFIVYALVFLMTQMLLQIGFWLQTYACNKNHPKLKSK